MVKWPSKLVIGLLFKKWSEVIKELTESNLLMYLNIYSWTTNTSSEIFFPQWGKTAEVCKPYKIQIQAFSLLPIVMGCAGTGVEWCLLLHLPSPGSLGERWGGRKIARRKRLRVDRLILPFSPKWKSGCSHEPHAPSFPTTLERGRQASLT